MGFRYTVKSLVPWAFLSNLTTALNSSPQREPFAVNLITRWLKKPLSFCSFCLKGQ